MNEKDSLEDVIKPEYTFSVDEVRNNLAVMRGREVLMWGILERYRLFNAFEQDQYQESPMLFLTCSGQERRIQAYGAMLPEHKKDINTFLKRRLKKTFIFRAVVGDFYAITGMKSF